MKTIKFFMLSLFAFVCCSIFHSCQNEEVLTSADMVGSWDIREVSVDSKHYQEWPFETTVCTFNQDGTYSQYGLFGSEKGTWTLSNKTIIVYQSGREYVRFLINDWNSSKISAIIYELGMSEMLWVKCVKL